MSHDPGGAAVDAMNAAMAARREAHAAGPCVGAEDCPLCATASINEQMARSSLLKLLRPSRREPPPRPMLTVADAIRLSVHRASLSFPADDLGQPTEEP